MKLTILWVVSVVCLHSINCEETCHRTNCKFSAANFHVQYLSITKVSGKNFSSWTPTAVIKVTERDQEKKERLCMKECEKAGRSQCKSAHLSPTADESECSLFSQDVYNHWPDTINTNRVSSSGWTSFHMLNSFCESQPCQNMGKCVPDFEKDVGTCVCDGFSGKYCENLDPLWTDGAGHWVIGDDSILTNIGKGASSLGNGVVGTGIILGVPDRKGKVIQCNGKGNELDFCFRAPEHGKTCMTNYLSSPYCSTGFTYGFWVRVAKFDNYETSYSTIIAQGGTSNDGGITIVYGKNIIIYLKNAYLRACHLPMADLHKQWHFIALSYNPSDRKLYCSMNNAYITSTNPSSTSEPISRTFQFGGKNPFYIVEVFYYPKFSTEEMMMAMFNKTKHRY